MDDATRLKESHEVVDILQPRQVLVEIADGVKVRLLKSAVASKRAPATQAPKEEPAREKEEEKN